MNLQRLIWTNMTEKRATRIATSAAILLMCSVVMAALLAIKVVAMLW